MTQQSCFRDSNCVSFKMSLLLKYLIVLFKFKSDESDHCFCSKIIESKSVKMLFINDAVNHIDKLFSKTNNTAAIVEHKRKYQYFNTSFASLLYTGVFIGLNEN